MQQKESSISNEEVAFMVSNASSLNVQIEKSMRQNPIWHRHFDITNLIKRFPKFRFKSLSEHIARNSDKN